VVFEQFIWAQSVEFEPSVVERRHLVDSVLGGLEFYQARACYCPCPCTQPRPSPNLHPIPRSLTPTFTVTMTRCWAGSTCAAHLHPHADAVMGDDSACVVGRCLGVWGQALTKAEQRKLADALEEETVEVGEPVIVEGDRASSMYIVKEVPDLDDRT
jgi:hypothetical protein